MEGGAAVTQKRPRGGKVPMGRKVPRMELREKAAELRKVSRQLPIASAEGAIIDMVKNNQAIVLIGETGSGKTTQVPQFLLKEFGHGVIGVTQPRRLAAITIARRVAEEVGTPLGHKVGYTVRFDDTTSPATRIKYMTDGILLRELLTDETLEAYSVIIIDEAHERGVNTDVLLGLLKRVAGKRRDLKVVVMSATLDAGLFSKFWNNCPVGYVQGRTFPVELHYAVEPQIDIVDAAVTTALQIHVDHPKDLGDILVFLTGQDTIEDAATILRDKAKLLGKDELQLIVVPLYANLSLDMQARAFVPPPAGARKVILSTNVAETSLTIPNIRFVVDCGFVKEKRYNPRTGMDSLTEVEVSKAQAKQRSGRAGRVTSGKCYRVYTEEAFLSLAATTEPEIRRVNLCSVVLQLKLLGIDNPLAFDFIQPPAEQHLVAALHLLFLLGALGTDGSLTDIGWEMAQYPIDPTFAKTLLTAERFGVVDDVVTILAMLSVENVLSTPGREDRELADKRRQAFASPHGDHLTLLNLAKDFKKQDSDAGRTAWCKNLFVNRRKMYQVFDVRKQLMDIHRTSQQKKRVKEGKEPLPKEGEHDEEEEGEGAEDDGAKKVHDQDHYSTIRKTFCYGFFMNIAQYNFDEKCYVTAEGRKEVHIHPTSVLFRARQKAPLVLYNELVHTKKRYLRDVIAVEEYWLLEAAPLRWRRIKG